MQTTFSLAQLANPDMRKSEKILRACVHCGFCTATCPTYVLLGDELDSPRGRIYLIKDMLENARPASEARGHPHRPLPVLPRLHDDLSFRRALHASGRSRPGLHRETYARPTGRTIGCARLLATMLPRPHLFRLALTGAALAALGAHLCCRGACAGMLASRKPAGAAARDRPARVFPAQASGAAGSRCSPAARSRCWRRRSTRPRSACSPATGSRWWSPRAQAAAARSCITWAARGGSESAKATHRRLGARARATGLDAMVINTSGCGTAIKDYGFMLRKIRRTPKAARGVSARTRHHRGSRRARDARRPEGEPKLAYHSACSMQHGQKDTARPRTCCAQAGSRSRSPEGTSAAAPPAPTTCSARARCRLRDRKAANITRLRPDVIATGNIGCMEQLAGGAVRSCTRWSCSTGRPPEAHPGSVKRGPRVGARAVDPRPDGRAPSKCRLDTGEGRFLIAQRGDMGG